MTALTIGWTGLASTGAQAIAALATLAAITSAAVNWRQWAAWLYELRREGKLFVLVGMIVSAVAFVGFFAAWAREKAEDIQSDATPALNIHPSAIHAQNLAAARTQIVSVAPDPRQSRHASPMKRETVRLAVNDSNGATQPQARSK